MSWAQDEWKNNLPHIAIQKIDAIERQNDQLKRELQQKKFLLENSEVALEQQKKKTVHEKSQNGILRKDLQVLEEQFRENVISREKVLHDIQTKESRISCLDGQLMKLKASLEQESSKLSKLQTEYEQEVFVRNKAQDLLKQKDNDIEKLKQRLSSSSEDIFKQSNVSQTMAIDTLISFDEPIMQTSHSNYNENLEPPQSESMKKIELQSSNSSYNIFGDIELNQTSCEPASNELWKKQLIDLNEKLKLKQSETTKLQQQYTETCFLLDKLKTEFNANLSEMNKVSDEIIKLRTNTEEKQLQNEELQRNLKILQQQYDCERHNSKAALKAQETRMKEQEKEMREEMARDQQLMKNQLNQMQIEFSEVQKKWNDKVHEYQILERNLFQANQDRESLKLYVEDQKQEMVLLKSNHLHSFNELKQELEKAYTKEVTVYQNKVEEKVRELAAVTEECKMQKNELLNINKNFIELKSHKNELEEIKTGMEKQILQLNHAIEENNLIARAQLIELEKQMTKKLADKNDHNISLSRSVDENLNKVKELTKDLEQKKHLSDDLKSKWDSCEFKLSKLLKEKSDVDKEFAIFISCAEKREKDLEVVVEKLILSEKLAKEQECILKDTNEKLNNELVICKNVYHDLTLSVSKKDQELLTAADRLEEHRKIVFELEHKLTEQKNCLEQLMHERNVLKEDLEKKPLELLGLLNEKDAKILHLTEELDKQQEKKGDVVKSFNQVLEEKVLLKSELDEVLVLLNIKTTELEELKCNLFDIQSEEKIRIDQLSKELEEKLEKISCLEVHEQENRCEWEREIKIKSDLLDKNQICISDLNETVKKLELVHVQKNDQISKLMIDLDVAVNNLSAEQELQQKTDKQNAILKELYDQSQQSLQSKCSEMKAMEQVFHDQYGVLKEDLHHQTESCNNLVEQIQAMLETIKVLENTKIRLEFNISVMVEDNEQLISDKSELACKVEEKEAQIKEISHKYDLISNQLNEVSSLLHFKEQEFNLLQQEFQKLEQDSISKETDLKVYIKELKTKNEEIDNELLFISKQADLLKEQNEDHTKHYDIISKDLAEISVMHDDVCIERNQLVVDVKLLKEEMKETVGLMQSKESSLQQLINDLESLREDLHLKTKLYEDLLSERNQIKKQLEDAENELQQARLSFDEKVESLKSLTLMFDVKEKSMQELLLNKENTILELELIISKLQKTLSTLEEDVTSKKEELKSSIVTILELQKNLKQNQNELLLLKETKENVDNQVEELYARISYLESEINAKDRQLHDTESEMKKALDIFEEQLSKKLAELLLAEEKNIKHEDSLQRINSDLLRVSEDLNTCMSEKTETEKHLVVLTNKVESQENCIEEKNLLLKETEKRVEEFFLQLQNALKSNEEQADIFSSKYEEFEVRAASYLKEINLMQKFKAELEGDLEQSRKLTESKELDNKNLIVDVTYLTEQLKEKDAEVKILLEQHEQIKLLFDDSKSHSEKLQMTLSITEQEKKDLEVSTEKLTVINKNLTHLVDSLTLESKAKTESIITMEKTLHSMTTCNEDLKKNYFELAEKCTSFSKKYDSLLTEKDFIEQLLATATEQKTFAEGMILTLETKYASNEHEKLNILKMNVDLKEEIDRCKSELKAAQVQKADSISLISKRDELVKNLYEDIKSLQNDLESKIEEMIEMEQSFAEEKSEHHNMLLQHENCILIKQREIETLQKEKEQMKNQLKKKKEMVTCLTEQIKQNDDALLKLKLQSEMQINQHVDQLQQLNEDIKGLELIKNDHNSQLKICNNTIQDLKVQLLESQERYKMLQQEREAELQDKLVKINCKDAELRELHKLMSTIEGELEISTLQFKEASLQLGYPKKEKNELQKECVVLNESQADNKRTNELWQIKSEEKLLYEEKMQKTIETFQFEKNMLLEEQLAISATLKMNKEALSCLQKEYLDINESFTLTSQELVKQNEKCITLNERICEGFEKEKVYQNSIKVLTDDNSALQIEKQNFIVEVQCLHSSILKNDEIIQSLSKEKEDLISQRNAFLNDRDSLFTESKAKSEEINKLHQQLNDITNQHCTSSKSLNLLLDEYKVKNVEFSENISTLEAKNTILDVANSKLKQTCDNLKLCLQEASISFIDLQKFLEEKDRHIKDLSKNYFSTEADLQCKLSLLSEVENEKASIESNLCDVQAVMKTLSETHDQLRQKFKEMQKKEHTAVLEKEKVQKQFDELSSEYSKKSELSILFQTELQQVKKDLESSSNENNQLFIKLRELESSKVQIENELEILKGDNQRFCEMQVLFGITSDELKTMKGQLIEQEVKNEKIKTDLLLEKQSLADKLSINEQERVFLEGNLIKKEQILNEFQVKLDCAENNAFVLEGKLQDQRKQFNEVHAQLQIECEKTTKLQQAYDNEKLSFCVLENKLKDSIENAIQINTKLEEISVSYEEVMGAKQKLQDEFLALKKENEELLKNNNTYLNDLLSDKALTKQLNDKVECLIGDCKSIEKARLDSQELVHNQVLQISQLKKDLFLKEENVTEVNQQLKGVIEELERWKSKATKVENVVECLNSDLHNCEDLIVLKEMLLLDKESNSREEFLLCQMQKNKKNLDLLQNLNSEISITEEFKIFLFNIKCHFEKLSKKNEILNNKNSKTKKELLEKAQLYDELHNNFQTSVEKNSELYLKIEMIQSEIDELIREKDNLLVQNSHLSRQFAEVVSEKKEKDEVYVILSKKNEALQGQIRSLESEVLSMEEMSKVKNDKILSLTLAESNFAKNLSVLKEELEEAKETNQKLKEKFEDEQEVNNQLMHTISEYEAQIKELSKQEEDLLNIKLMMESKCKDLNQSLQNLQIEKDEIFEQLLVTKKKLSEDKEIHLVVSHEKDCLNAEVKCLKEELNDAKESLEYLSTVKDEFSSQLKLKCQELNELTEKHLEEKKMLDATIIEMNLKKEQTKIHLDTLIKEKISQDVDLQAKINEVSFLKETVEKYTFEISRLEKSYCDELEKNVLANADLSLLRSSIDEIQLMLDNERKAAHGMQLKLDKTNQTVYKLEKDLVSMTSNHLLKTKECNEISEKLAGVVSELNLQIEKTLSKQSKLDQIKDTLLKNETNKEEMDLGELTDFNSLILQLQEKVAILERDQSRAIEKAVEEERIHIVEASKQFVIDRENENQRRNQDLVDEIEAKNKKIENLLKKVVNQEELCKQYEFAIEKEKEAYKEVVRQCEDRLRVIPQETKPSRFSGDELHELRERLDRFKEQNENLKMDLAKTVDDYEKERSKEAHQVENLKEECENLRALCQEKDADLKKLNLLNKEPAAKLKQLVDLRESLSKHKERNTELELKYEELEQKFKMMSKDKDKEITSLMKQLSLSTETNDCLQKQIKELLLKLAEFEKLNKASNSLLKVSLVSPITKSLSGLKVLSSEDEESHAIKAVQTPKRATQDALSDSLAKRSRLTSVKEEVCEPKRMTSPAIHARRRKSLRLAAKPYAKDLSSSDEDLINKPVESCEKENLAASSCVSHFHSESTPGPVPVLLSPVGNKNQCSSTGLSKKNLREINPPLHLPTTRVTRSKSGSSLKIEPTHCNNRPASIASISDISMKKVDSRKPLKTELGSEDEKCNMQ